MFLTKRKKGMTFIGHTLQWDIIRLVLHKLLGGAQLMAHVAEQLLALLKHVEIYERHLEVAVVLGLLYAVDVVLSHYREVVLALVGHGQSVTIVLEACC